MRLREWVCCNYHSLTAQSHRGFLSDSGEPVCVSRQQNRWVKNYSMSVMLEEQIWEEFPPRRHVIFAVPFQSFPHLPSSAPCWQSREKWHLFGTKQSGQQKRSLPPTHVSAAREQQGRSNWEDNAIIRNTNETWLTTPGATFWRIRSERIQIVFLINPKHYHVFKTRKSVGVCKSLFYQHNFLDTGRQRGRPITEGFDPASPSCWGWREDAFSSMQVPLICSINAHWASNEPASTNSWASRAMNNIH